MSGMLKRTARDMAAVALMTSGGLYGVDLLNAGQYLHLTAARLTALARAVTVHRPCRARSQH